MTKFEGKSIIVTGGGSGIGRAVALSLMKAGALVTVADRDTAAAERVIAEGKGLLGSGHAVTIDVTVEEEVAAMIDSAVAAFDRVDGACNAAGVAPLGKILHELTTSDWDRAHAINLRGLFVSMKYQIASMLRSGGGSIVNIGSTAGVKGFPHCAEYCSAKSGVIGLVKGAAIDYAKAGIRINAVLPGATATPMMDAVVAEYPEREAELAAVHPMGRLGQPPEIASAVEWLLSDAASFVTGICLAVDGGHTAS